ncbi:hypothetical protein G6O69_19380 [Pseudenhygromyxa sp. WMMC2535]|uniref:hypothetical protein n=1 Tax=Pseudenhygromyxa sp. WMMC2535 TaxID=2712867 RepID=UPI001551EC6D|nr:hypothetical protein [Pseudenhygromyxa sp. WMMC2535]NVB40016.1 hypothetical protein [Pseudenhygromyxa sp. WMMC2535]
MAAPSTLLPRARRFAGSISCVLTVALVSSGCAAFGDSGMGSGFRAPGAMTRANVDLSRPELQQFAVANTMTDLERDVRIETGGEVEHEKVTPALFWTGIIVGTVAAAGAIGFGVGGYVTRGQLQDGYETSMTEAERDTLVTRGERFNTLAATGAALAVIGYALAIVTYAVDWNRCGPLVRKHEKRNARRGCDAL